LICSAAEEAKEIEIFVDKTNYYFQNYLVSVILILIFEPLAVILTFDAVVLEAVVLEAVAVAADEAAADDLLLLMMTKLALPPPEEEPLLIFATELDGPTPIAIQNNSLLYDPVFFVNECLVLLDPQNSDRNHFSGRKMELCHS
jgi:hypothetical protein